MAYLAYRTRRNARPMDGRRPVRTLVRLVVPGFWWTRPTPDELGFLLIRDRNVFRIRFPLSDDALPADGSGKTAPEFCPLLSCSILCLERLRSWLC